MNEEEAAIYERDARRCRAEADRLRALAGDPQAAQEIRDGVEALLPRSVPIPVCRVPYDAPELLP